MICLPDTLNLNIGLHHRRQSVRGGTGFQLGEIRGSVAELAPAAGSAIESAGLFGSRSRGSAMPIAVVRARHSAGLATMALRR